MPSCTYKASLKSSLYSRGHHHRTFREIGSAKFSPNMFQLWERKDLNLFLGAEILSCWSFSTIKAPRAQSHTLGLSFLFSTLSQCTGCCVWDPSQPPAPVLPRTFLYCKSDSSALAIWIIRQQNEFITTTQWYVGQLKCTKWNVHLQKLVLLFLEENSILRLPWPRNEFSYSFKTSLQSVHLQLNFFFKVSDT